MRFLFLNAFQAVALGAWSVLWISAAIVVRLATGRADRALAMARTRWAPGVLWISRCTFRVEGGEAVDFSRPHIFVMNHQSALDIPVAFRFLPVNLRFVAKRALAYVPFLGQYMWATGMIFVDRGRSERAIASLRRAGRRIREGASILAYPEGTRSTDGTIQPFKKGPFVLAIEAGVPVVPVVIEGAQTVLARGGFAVRPGEVRFKIGAPIPTEGLTRGDRDRLLVSVREAMIELHRSLGGKGGDLLHPVAARGQEGVPAPDEAPARRSA